ncbi:MAG: hypothetical protein JRH20_19500 [Deltaproteobacteria bacterium]|nr:hypothetical protein [Deltaproteobacteria bacterium]
MRKSTLLSTALLLAGLLIAGPSFGAKGRFWAHGNNKLAKNAPQKSLTVAKARLAVANAINLKLGAEVGKLHLRVKAKDIKISVKTAADGRVLFSAKIRADGRTKAAKKFKTTATFRGTLDISVKAPAKDAVRLAAYNLSQQPSRSHKTSTQNWRAAETALSEAHQESASRVTFFTGNVPAKFNDIAKSLK